MRSLQLEARRHGSGSRGRGNSRGRGTSQGRREVSSMVLGRRTLTISFFRSRPVATALVLEVAGTATFAGT